VEEADTTASFSHSDMSAPNMKGQNSGVQMGGD
jgi:hypothetical protein